MKTRRSKRIIKAKASSASKNPSAPPIYTRGDIVAIVGEEAPDFVYLYILKEDVYSLD